MYRPFLLQICIITTCISHLISLEIPGIPNMDNLDEIAFKRKAVGPCVACQNLVKSFLTALEETTRQSFAGGDADWEKQKLGTYENSELRFIEIQEMLCSDVKLGKDQCYNLAEEYESELEDWFYTQRKKYTNLYESFCINKLKVCCPNNTYGPDCVLCPGGIEKPCGGHGKCMKGGTREEPASCACDAGYTGELCEKCEKGYYEETDISVLSCKVCDKACKDHCRGPGPKNCEVCSSGYHFLPNEGCIEHLEESENKVVSNESDVANSDKASSESEYSSVDHLPNDSADNESEDLKLVSNVEDSNVNNAVHPEL